MYKSFLVALVISVGLAGAGLAQVPTWKLEFLGTPHPDLTGTFVVALNDAGLTVGSGYISGWKRAWVAGPDQEFEVLPLPAGADWAQAYDVNSSGVVAGSVLFDGSLSQGVLWLPGAGGYEVFLLPSGPGGFVPFDARGLNDRGDVVGKYGILGGSYHWDESNGVTQLPSGTFPEVPEEINEQRQIIGGSHRMDLDTMVLEDLGNPTGTSYNYVYTELTYLNDTGEAAGYAVVATSQPPYLPVRYTDGPVWKLFNSFPWTSASVSGLAASGDVVFQLGAYFGMFAYVEGFGSIALEDMLAPAFADWDVTGTSTLAMSRSGRVACTAYNSVTGEGGVALLTPLGFEDLGGAAAGALGDPVLSGYGSLIPGEPVRVRLASAAPDSVVYLIWATSSNPMPKFGGILYANPRRKITRFRTDALGRFETTFDWPSVPPGSSIYLQAAVVDSTSEYPLTLSNALQGVTQ